MQMHVGVQAKTNKHTRTHTSRLCDDIRSNTPPWKEYWPMAAAIVATLLTWVACSKRLEALNSEPPSGLVHSAVQLQLLHTSTE